MDAAKWSQQGNHHQEIGLMKPMEEMVSSNSACTGRPVLERKARPPEQLNCPRCNSTNTKFCYYNNYSLTQPRYFCKTCRRYWTEGGSLRNVPVGGGSRKNKRSSLSSTSAPTQASSHLAPPKVIPDLNPPNNLSHLSSSHSPAADKIPKGQDLNLAFPAMQESHHQQAMSQFLQPPKIENNGSHHQENNPVPSSSSSPHSVAYDPSLSALELLRTGMAGRGLSPFVPAGPVMDSNTLYSSGFAMHDYKPNLGFTIENGLGNRAAMNGVHQDNNGGSAGRINFFPFGEMKQLSGTSNEADQSKGQGNSSGGYWGNNGVLGGGPW